MATTENTRIVTFPPLSEGEATKIDGLLKTMGEFMDVKLTVKEVRVLAVEFDSERGDVAQVLQRIAAAKKPKK